MGRWCRLPRADGFPGQRGELVDHPGATAPEDWAQHMCRDIEKGRVIGRRQSVVIVAEGARDRSGNPITVDQIRTVLEKELSEDTRITILGHVQRGGAPSAFDRYLATLLAHAAVERLLTDAPDAPAQLIGLGGNRVVNSPLMECVAQTEAVAERIKAHDFDGAMLLRGGSFRESYQILRTVQQAAPRPAPAGRRRFRLAVVPAAVRQDQRRCAPPSARSGPRYGAGGEEQFRGSTASRKWAGWTSAAGCPTEGAEIGTNRYMPSGAAIAQIAKQVAAHRINGLLMAGGWAGYQARSRAAPAPPALRRPRHPIVCLPMTINNDVPGTELSIGSDTALNSIVADVDKIRQSAVATRRVFVVEVMGRECGYLALLSGLATGAERIYLPEEGITLDDLTADASTPSQTVSAPETARPDHPQRECRSRLHHRIHHIAVPERGRGAVRRPAGDPGARPGGRRPIPVRSDPGDQTDRALHRIPVRATRIRRSGQRDDRIPVRAAAVHRPHLLPDADRPRRPAAAGTALDGPPRPGKDHARLVVTAVSSSVRTALRAT